MFDMLTADAASKHGHEFSPQARVAQVARWAPRISPFKVLPYRQLRARSGRATMTDLKEEPEEAEKPGTSAQQLRREISITDLKIPGAFEDYPPSPPRLAIVEESIPVEELQPEVQPIVTEDVLPTPEKRAHRTKSTYQFAYPASGISQTRRTVLQLHIQTLSGFHRPAFEVLPLDVIDNANPVKQRIKRIGKGKAVANVKDVVVIRSGQYSSFGTEQDDNDATSRDVIGLISNSPSLEDGRTTAQIVTESDSWTVIHEKNNTYDIMPFGETTCAARWYVPKTQKRSSISSSSGISDTKLYFAVISPHTKQHPTLACMTRKSLDIYDTYKQSYNSFTSTSTTTCNSTSNSAPSTPLSKSFSIDSSSQWNDQIVHVNEAMRQLILVTSIWVSFCEGWSPISKMIDLSPQPVTKAPTPKRNSIVSLTPRRASTAMATTPESTVPLTLPTLSAPPKSRSLSLTLRRPKSAGIALTPASLTPVPSDTTISIKSEAERQPSTDSATPLSIKALRRRSLGLSIRRPKSAGVPTPSTVTPLSSYPASVTESKHEKDSVATDVTVPDVQDSSVEAQQQPERPSTPMETEASLKEDLMIEDSPEKDQGVSLIQEDPTAQFRHLLSMNNNNMTNSFTSPRPKSRLQNLIRRRSIATPPPGFSAPVRVASPHVLPIAQPQPRPLAETPSKAPAEVLLALESPEAEESDEEFHPGLNGPYWRAFDNMQSLPYKQPDEAIPEPEIKETPTAEGRATRWFSGLKRSVSRRRTSTPNPN